MPVTAPKMLAPSHRHRLLRRRSFLVGITSPRGAGCLALLALAFFVAADTVLHGASSSSSSRARSRTAGHGGAGGDRRPPRITIFSAPLRHPDGSPARQELAVRSWLALPGDVSVVLLGSQHPSALVLAGRLGRRVTVDASIDTSFTGTPFFHSMVARAQAAADSDICVLLDADIVLLPETVALLTDLSRADRDWFLVFMSRNISDFPYNLSGNGKEWIHPDGEELGFTKLQKTPFDRSMPDSTDRGLVMVWNNPSRPLVAGVLPSFLYGRGTHTWWLLHEVLSSEMRMILDASSLALGLYPANPSAKRGDRDARLPDGSWEYNVNRHLATVYGSYCYQLLGRQQPIMHKVVMHPGEYLLSRVEELSFSNYVIGEEQSVYEGGRIWKKESICLSDHLQNYSSGISEAADVPYSLRSVLRFVADRNGSVVLGVAGASYRDMLMSWVCRLRHLRVTNFVVCALDHETYQFSLFQGLPVFRDQLSPKNISFDECHFGTQCFQQVTKVKSRIVLEILRLGYNVLLSDVDVYWFRNPLQFLHSLGPNTLAAQSDEYNQTGPINLPRKLNSGFYYARSDAATIAAMEMVVEHAMKSSSSEQPSFYDVLCGEQGANRVAGDRCLEPRTKLTVVFLDRVRFPNGAYGDLWERRDVRSACREIGCFVIHNNWVNGRKKKLQRQMASGLWDYDPSSRMCLQNWSDARRKPGKTNNRIF